MTKSQQVAADVAALLRARSPLIWIVTREEARVERYLIEACAKAKLAPMAWDCAVGASNMQGQPFAAGGPDPVQMFEAIRERAVGRSNPDRTAWIMRDLPAWIGGPGAMTTLRWLRNLARLLPNVDLDRQQSLIVLSPSGDVPPELANHATVVEWPLPDRDEIGAMLDVICQQYQVNLNGQREVAIDATLGLSGEEAQACYSKSLVQTRTIDTAAVTGEKKRVIARERVLEWHDPLPGGLDAVGGLDALKTWVVGRSVAYSAAARKYRLPAPKGVVLVGVPGCGKSLSAKAIATAYAVPLVRLDMGALRSKFVGESESNLRRALKQIEALGRVVVWIDEVEKAMQGATSGSADGGVSADALGAILAWMQERQGEAIVVATANDVRVLPPELLRKGRFDEVFFVDLPTLSERVAVLAAAIRAHGRDPKDVGPLAQFEVLARSTDGFTGAELASLVPEAMFAAFNDGEREIKVTDLLTAAKAVVPLSKSASEKIDALRRWAAENARPATSPAKRDDYAPTAGRKLDI